MLRYIEPWSPEFAAAVELRYEVLYAPFGLPRELVAEHDRMACLHLIADVDGRLVGHARLYAQDGNAELHEVAVTKRARKKGVGTELVRELLRVAASLDRDSVQVDACCDSTRFFEKLGFEPVGDIFASERTGTPCRRLVISVAGPTSPLLP